MAVTITYDGFGVVANADSLTTDTAGGAWAELGGGTISLNPDVYLYGSASIGSKYASKSGFTYFTATTALDFTTTTGTEFGQYIYFWVNIQSASAFQTLVNDGFHLVVGSDTSNYYKFPIAGSDDANGWAGGWKMFVCDVTLGQTVGTPVDSAIDTFGVWIDTIVSVRADSIFLSQIACAKGLKVEGTSSTMYDDIIAWTEDYANRAAGMFQSRGQTYFSLGSLTLHSDTANTIVSASGNNVEYEKSEFHNGTIWTTTYPTTANLISTTDTGGNTVSMTDTNVGLSGNSVNKVKIDSTSGTLYDKIGGYVKWLSTLVANATDSFSGVVFSLYDARTLGTEDYTNCTLDGSSKLTVGATSSFSNNIINGTSGVSSLSVATLEYAPSNTFNSSGSNHAVELTTIGDGTMDWTCLTTGFDSGATGSPVTPTSTGNEDIYITATTGTVTISVSTGSTIPSIRSAGATVNVVAGQVTTLITVRDIDTQAVIVGARVFLEGSGGALDGVTIFNTITDVNGQVSDTRSIAADQLVVGRVRMSTSSPYYKTVPISETISSTAGLTLNVSMIRDD